MRRFEEPARLKVCEVCGRAMPRSITGAMCAACQDNKLYHEVKEYIQKNNVTDTQVASHFHIPLAQVRNWIQNERIHYASPW